MKSLIVFAWAMEIVGVTGGAANSVYTTFGEKLPDTLLGYLPAIPMAALAMAELGRVPLASVVYNKRSIMKIIALSGIAALGYLAVENWTFGFERVVDLRLKPVKVAQQKLNKAEFDLTSARQERDQLAAGAKEKREELGRSLLQWEKGIEQTTAQIGQEAKSHQENLVQIREACRLIRDRCMVQRSQDEDRRYGDEIARLNSQLYLQRDKKDRIHSQIEDLTEKDAKAVLALHRSVTEAEDRVKDFRQEFRSAADGNQIYRLAASWFGAAVSDVTQEQFSKARLVFSTFSSIAVALAGSVAALVYYSHNRVPGSPSELASLVAPLLRARRAYYARKRKRVVREVPGPERVEYRDGQAPPIVIEKEVSRFIDRIILIPRFGIRFPVYLNSLFRRENDADANSHISNVTAFAKRGA
ncbi:MAG TPA: hypothetical protein VNY07_15105 [Chthoniobacterales bacterium]|nr:hypothetical protein [Chthoniobacterales bacterium]